MISNTDSTLDAYPAEYIRVKIYTGGQPTNGETRDLSKGASINLDQRFVRRSWIADCLDMRSAANASR
jgi:hypothetical protein